MNTIVVDRKQAREFLSFNEITLAAIVVASGRLSDSQTGFDPTRFALGSPTPRKFG